MSYDPRDDETAEAPTVAGEQAEYPVATATLGEDIGVVYLMDDNGYEYLYFDGDNRLFWTTDLDSVVTQLEDLGWTVTLED